jgi:hypothetical protein
METGLGPGSAFDLVGLAVDFDSDFGNGSVGG